MSDDFDFELDLPPKVDIKQKKEPREESSKSKLSLMDKLALLKKSNQSSIEETQEKIKKSSDKKTDKNPVAPHKEKDHNKNPEAGNVSNLQKMLNKIKSNNDSLKKQASIVSEEDNSNVYEKVKSKIDSNQKKFEEKINPGFDKASNILDSVKINDNFDKDFKEGKKFEKKIIREDSLFDNNNNHKENERNNKSNLNLSDSIQEIDDIIEPPTEKSRNKNENTKAGNKVINTKLRNTSEIEKVLDNINLFPANKKGNKAIEQKNKLNEDSLEMLITDSNLDEIELLDDEKKEDLNNRENIYNNNTNSKYNPLKEEEIKLKETEVSKGSFDMDTDEENEKNYSGNSNTKNIINKNNEKRSEMNNDNINNKDEEREKSMNNSDLINNLLNPDKNKDMNNSDLINNLLNPNKKKNNENSPRINNLNQFTEKGSNFHLKNDDFNISENLINLSNEIQEYKPSNNDISKLNAEDEIKKSLISNKNDSLFYKDSNSNLKDNISSQKKKKLNDSLFEEKNTLDNNVDNGFRKEIIDSANKETPVNEQKNIKDLFKLFQDNDDEEDKILHEKILLIDHSINLNKNDLAKNVLQKEPITNNINEHSQKPPSLNDYNFQINKVTNNKETNENKNFIIFDVDDIPEIEENKEEEEDLNVVNLDKMETKSLLNKTDNKINNMFNMKNNNNDSLGLFHNSNKNESPTKQKEKEDTVAKTEQSLLKDKNKKEETYNEQKKLDIAIDNKKGIFYFYLVNFFIKRI